MKTRFNLELVVDCDFDLCQEEIDFYTNTILCVENELFLHSNEIGDQVGEIVSIKVTSVNQIDDAQPESPE